MAVRLAYIHLLIARAVVMRDKLCTYAQDQLPGEKYCDPAEADLWWPKRLSRDLEVYTETTIRPSSTVDCCRTKSFALGRTKKRFYVARTCAR